MANLKETPSQTAGPFVHIGCTPGFAGIYDADLGSTLPPDAIGKRIGVEGKIFDGNNEPLRDAMVELWQADGAGDWGIWLRCASDLSTGFFMFDTVKPASKDASAPHLNLWIVARGINLGLSTRVYFPDEDNANNPLLSLTGPRRETLIARRPDAEEDERDIGWPVYRFDIRLQGEKETVFLDV